MTKAPLVLIVMSDDAVEEGKILINKGTLFATSSDEISAHLQSHETTSVSNSETFAISMHAPTFNTGNVCISCLLMIPSRD